MSEIPGQRAERTPGAVWHMHPDLHAQVVAQADEIARHFLESRLGVTFAETAPEWLAQRQAETEGRAR